MKTYITIAIAAFALILSNAVLACPCNKDHGGDHAQASQTELESTLNLDSLKSAPASSDQSLEDTQSLLAQ